MREITKIRRLIFKYNELMLIKDIIGKMPERGCDIRCIVKDGKPVTLPRDLKRLLNYIGVYEAAFKKSLKMLANNTEREIIEHLVKKRHSINKTSMTLYVSTATVSRAIKKFRELFSDNIRLSKRIIFPLLKIKKL